MSGAKYIAGSLILLALLFSGGNYLYDNFVAEGQPAQQSITGTFPLPEEAPKAGFENFNFSHPRLPHPGTEDITRIWAKNPDYFNRPRKNTDHLEDSLYSSTLTAYIEPGQQNLDRLLQKLLKMPFGYRGNNVKHLAVAYDWLYHQWNDVQRQQLLTRLIQGCHTNIQVIREQKLSPYNVFLYNSPLQNLVYCALAIYGDSDQAQPVMNFTYDLWIRRVLPVWRQVMGKNGGWHEGGEYVGIGIGQAIYQIPAAWRAATGEDYFKSEPGIRGFLDFLIYRTRPDGTQFRWGDAGYFNRQSPDSIALAIEYRHKAAYTFLKPPRKLVPSSYPWGPLTDDLLYDPQAIQSMPKIKYFDGIGLVVARSDWSENALYITFKAGDNYWSHSHLDQGSFTVYKNGALVIDSGFYGPVYGSDHHMNYSYQTISHNAVTVTDPQDTVPMPGQKNDRYIAIDGGQRRVGSGWGIDPAPIDILEWLQKREAFHTATVDKINISGTRLLLRADLTPAYTNALSGRGTFADRTYRVETITRTFALDLDNSVVIIYDQLIKTNPQLAERWLLHSIAEPEITQSQFKIPLPRKASDAGSQATLWGSVLLPEPSNIKKLGGPGFEFYVEGKNYDEQGHIVNAINKKPHTEPGNWRLEIDDPGPEKKTQFLVLLQAIPENNSAHLLTGIELTTTDKGLQLSYQGLTGTVNWIIAPNNPWNIGH